MSDRKLKVVETGEVYEFGKKPETVGERARRLHHEAQVLAAEEVEMLRNTLADAVARAEAIRDGGEIFPIGVREQARQLTDMLPLAMQTLQALEERHLRAITREPVPPVWADLRPPKP